MPNYRIGPADLVVDQDTGELIGYALKDGSLRPLIRAQGTIAATDNINESTDATLNPGSGAINSGDEADMLDTAAGYVVGSRFLRTEGETPILYECFALPATAAENWAPIRGFATQAQAEAGVATDAMMSPLRTKQAIEALGAAGTGIDSSLTALQIQAGGLVGTPKFFMASDTQDLYWCPAAAEAYLIVQGAVQPSFRGVFTSVANMEGVSPAAVLGDHAILNIASLPYPMKCTYTGTAWRAAESLMFETASRAAGVGTSDEQVAASWIQALPAGFPKLFRQYETLVHARRSGIANNMTSLIFRLGSNSDGISNTALMTTNGNYISGSDTTRAAGYVFQLNSTNKVRSFQSSQQGGTYAGILYDVADEAEVTLGGSDDFDDALYMSVCVKMAGGTDVPTLTIRHTWLP